MSVVYATVPISVITDLQDYLSNHGAHDLSTWQVDIKLYRANASSFGQENKGRLLFTIWASHEPDNLYVSYANSASNENESVNDGVLLTPTFHKILDTKLKSLWQLRQTFKGEGHILKCDDGGIIRISNILVQGNYKGLLMDADPTPQCMKLVKACAEEFGIKNATPVEEETAVGLARAKLYQRVYQ